MGSRDPRIDLYIEKSAPFAKPILTYLRDVVHEACPEVQETMKWKAMALNEQQVQPKRPAKHPKKPLAAPPYFISALKKNKKALATYESFPPSHKRDYVEWITDAKGEDTRQRRMATAIEWMAEGKPRNWKYMK